MVKRTVTQSVGNFFNVSPAYREAYAKRGGISRRQTVVARHLNDKYRFGRDGAKQRALEEALERGCPHVSEHSLAVDSNQLRTAYLYFNGTPEERARIRGLLEKKPQAVVPLLFLLQDGFTDW